MLLMVVRGPSGVADAAVLSPPEQLLPLLLMLILIVCCFPGAC
jgi:hypothetical protein